MRRNLGQTSFSFSTWGGARPGAGRKKVSEESVPHARRPELAARHPVHVTMRIARGLPSLRKSRIFRELERAFRAGRERFGFRLVHFAVLSNHVHLVVEAEGALSLSRGMKGLAVRVARAVNRAVGRTGAVCAERYHARALRTPREVRNALAYVLGNARRHGLWVRRGALDSCSSGRWFDGWIGVKRAIGLEGAPVTRARTWLLRLGWTKHGLLPVPT
jgi:putative transposase